MNDWDDLLLTGGFAPRASIFAGLTLEQVAERPNGVSHSIYQELWHAAMALKISLDEGSRSSQSFMAFLLSFDGCQKLEHTFCQQCGSARVVRW